MRTQTLDTLVPGMSGCVHSLSGEPEITHSLMEIGLHPGARVRLVRRAPMGSPLEVAVGGSRFAIRKDLARMISLALDV